MSLNSNSTHQLCNELNQTHQQNELTHKLICYRLPINQTINQALNQWSQYCRPYIGCAVL